MNFIEESGYLGVQTIQELLALFDQLSNSRLDERQVARHIENFLQKHDGKADENFHWEKAAFEFYPILSQQGDRLGTYFGPIPARFLELY